jgi:putative ABC transport system permease protein
MRTSYIVHELQHRSARTLINVLGIAVGIALFVSINAVSTGYQKAVSQPFANLGADLVVQRAEKNQTLGEETLSMQGVKLPFSNQTISAEELAALGKIDGVAATSGALLLWEFLPGGFRTIMGADLAQPDLGPVRLAQWISKGHLPEQPGEAMMEKHFAKFRGTRLGDTLEIGGKPFKIVGLLEIREGAQVAAANIYLRLSDAQSLLTDATLPLNVAYLRLRDPAEQHRIQQEIIKTLPVMSVSSSDSFLELMGGVSLISGQFALVASGVALLGAILLILKSMTASLVERTQEIGVLKAVGWTRRDIQEQLLGEAMVQCVLGGILGLCLGYMGAFLVGTLSLPMATPWALNPLPASAKIGELSNQVIRLPIRFSWELLTISLSIVVATGGIAALAMGKAAAKMKPADIFRKL